MADAIAVLARPRPVGQVAGSVREHLESGAAESPTLDARRRRTPCCWSPARRPARRWPTAADASSATGRSCSRPASRARAARSARRWSTSARESARQRPAVRARPCMLVGCGGETTVTLAQRRRVRRRRPQPGGGASARRCGCERRAGGRGVPRHRRLGRRHRCRRRGRRRAHRRPRRASSGVDLARGAARARSGAALRALGDLIVTGADRHQRQRHVRDRVATGGGGS